MHLFIPVLKSEVSDGEHDQVFVIKIQVQEVLGFTVFVDHRHLFFEKFYETGKHGWVVWGDLAAPPELLAWSNRIKAKQTFIVLLELVAIAAVYSSPIALAFRGRDVLHFADNQSANMGIVKGRSSSPDLNAVIGELHQTWSGLGIRPWIEYVRSAANVADLPSRLEGNLVSDTLGLLTQQVVVSLPPSLRAVVAGR